MSPPATSSPSGRQKRGLMAQAEARRRSLSMEGSSPSQAAPAARQMSLLFSAASAAALPAERRAMAFRSRERTGPAVMMVGSVFVQVFPRILRCSGRTIVAKFSLAFPMPAPPPFTLAAAAAGPRARVPATAAWAVLRRATARRQLLASRAWDPLAARAACATRTWSSARRAAAAGRLAAPPQL